MFLYSEMGDARTYSILTLVKWTTDNRNCDIFYGQNGWAGDFGGLFAHHVKLLKNMIRKDKIAVNFVPRTDKFIGAIRHFKRPRILQKAFRQQQPHFYSNIWE
jgi:hypothetical protein